MSSVTWVRQNSKYEISSKQHILQLMSKGELYTDNGDFPISYWSSDYIQTVSIEMESDINISPIGSSTEPFTGSFDGDYFSITDWSFSSIESYIGLFGSVQGSTIENINLEGTWALSGGGTCGFLAGSVSSNSSVYNICGDFSSGYITCTGDDIGGMIGSVSDSIVEGITVKGILTNINGGDNVGGLIGYLENSPVKYIRNVVRFSSGISSANYSAGVIGTSDMSDLQYVFNSMTGNITGTSCGGVVCVCIGTTSTQIGNIVCSMTGNISATGSGNLGVSGGVFGYFETSAGDCISDSLVNYMSGGITGLFSGGLIGTAPDAGTNFSTVTNSINAMNGNVDYASVADPGILHNIHIKVVETFGITYTNISHPTLGNTTKLNVLSGSFIKHPEFSEIPYFPFEGTDSVGNSYFFEFVFANISGSSSYPEYTHFVISSDNVSGPIEVQVQLEDNSVEYLYKVNTSTDIVVANGTVVVIYSSGTVVDETGEKIFPVRSISAFSTSPFSVTINWEEIDYATSYRIDYGSGNSVIVRNELTTDIYNLEAETVYEFKLYSSEDDIVYTEVVECVVDITTPVNSPSGYNTSAFFKDGIYDFSHFAPGKASELSSIVTDILDKDETVKLVVNGVASELLVPGVSGETIEVVDNDEYILPFKQIDGSGQSIVVQGLYEGTVTYDESSNTVDIDGVSYSPGDTVLIDGVRITIRNI